MRGVIDALTGDRQLRVFVTADKITTMPSRRTRRLQLLDCVARRSSLACGTPRLR